VQDADRRTLSFPRGPAPGARFTPDYVSEIARFAYFWAWPLVNVFNRYIAFKRVRRPILVGGIAPVALINHVAMLHDHIGWKQRYIACPSQDLIYGFGILDLAREPVVVQVPDFGLLGLSGDRSQDRRFRQSWHDVRYEAGLLSAVRPPSGIAASFRGSTNVATLIPRVFQEDDKADNEVLQPLIQEIAVYPLSEFDGKVKTRDWSSLPSLPWIKLGEEEWKWVDPATFFDILPEVLDAARPLPGEEALYALVRSVLDAAAVDKTLRKVLKDAAAEADETLVKPLLQFRNFGIPLPDNWTTVINSAEFGTDYYTRTAVAKSNIFINRPRETRYFYQDLDMRGGRLTGTGRYTITFKETPPVKGFWSITLYNQQHFFATIALNRFSLGTKSKGLRFEPDGSLVIHVQNEPPTDDRLSNWLPAPPDEFSLYIRVSRKLPRDAGLRLRSSPLRHHSVTMT
jgi:hypothetical protein